MTACGAGTCARRCRSSCCRPRRRPGSSRASSPPPRGRRSGRAWPPGSPRSSPMDQPGPGGRRGRPGAGPRHAERVGPGPAEPPAPGPAPRPPGHRRVRPLPPRAAAATLAVAVAARAPVPLALPAGTAFVAPGGGDVPTVLETTAFCDAVPGRVAAVALAADGLVTNNRPDNLGAGVPPFGAPHAPAPPSGSGSTFHGRAPRADAEPGRRTGPSGHPPGGKRRRRPARRRAAAAGLGGPGRRSWIALPVERDGTGGWCRAASSSSAPLCGLVGHHPPPALGGPAAALAAGRPTHDAYRWGPHRPVTLNGVEAPAVRTIRDDEVATPVAAPPGPRHPVCPRPRCVPGSVVLDIQRRRGRRIRCRRPGHRGLD